MKPSPVVEEEDEEPITEPFGLPSGWDEEALAKELAVAGPSPVDEAALRKQMANSEHILRTESNTKLVRRICDDSISLYDAYMLEAERRIIVGREEHIPLYISSIGAHVSNLFSVTSCGVVQHRDNSPNAPSISEANSRCIMNRPELKTKHGILTSVEGGRVRDLRLHIMIVGPPASGKGEYPQLFISREGGLVNQNVIPSKFVQRITSAGMFGSVMADPKNPRRGIYVAGDAFEYCSGFIGCEEFNFVKSAAGSQHSAGLEDSMLTFLERGIVETTMRHGSYAYAVCTTAWLGNQTDRMWFGSGESGMSRRMAVDYSIITLQRNRELKAARRARLKVPSSNEVYSTLSNRLGEMIRKFNVRRVVVSADWYEFLDTFDLDSRSNYFGTLHNEETILDRIAIGYTLMRRSPKDWDSEELIIRLDDPLRNLIRRQILIREMLFANSSLLDCEVMLRLEGHKKDPIRREEFIREMCRLGGYSTQRVEATILALEKRGRLILEPHGQIWNPIIGLSGDNKWSALRQVTVGSS